MRSPTNLARVKSRPTFRNPKYPTTPHAIARVPYFAVPRPRIRIGITTTATSRGAPQPIRFHIALRASKPPEASCACLAASPDSSMLQFFLVKNPNYSKVCLITDKPFEGGSYRRAVEDN